MHEHARHIVWLNRLAATHLEERGTSSMRSLCVHIDIYTQITHSLRGISSSGSSAASFGSTAHARTQCEGLSAARSRARAGVDTTNRTEEDTYSRLGAVVVDYTAVSQSGSGCVCVRVCVCVGEGGDKTRALEEVNNNNKLACDCDASTHI